MKNSTLDRQHPGIQLAASLLGSQYALILLDAWHLAPKMARCQHIIEIYDKMLASRHPGYLYKIGIFGCQFIIKQGEALSRFPLHHSKGRL